MKIQSLPPEISQIVENVLSRDVEESFKKFLDPDPEADDFQNLVSSSLCTYTSVVNFREDPFSSFNFLRYVANGQTDRQTPGIT